MVCDLTGKVALVTGAAGGLGRDMVIGLASSGAVVVIADIDVDSCNELLREVESIGGKAITKFLDVTDVYQVRETFDTVFSELGSFDILVNSAGITKRLEPLNYPIDVFNKIIDVNLRGSFYCCQAAANIMAKKKYGKIINIASVGGVVGLPNTVAYCASKGGVVNMTRALAIDLAQYKINVNAIAPALTKTKIATQVFSDENQLKWFMDRIPMGRLCSPQDVANMVVFLSSSQSDFVTGQIIGVDGGWVSQ